MAGLPLLALATSTEALGTAVVLPTVTVLHNGNAVQLPALEVVEEKDGLPIMGLIQQTYQGGPEGNTWEITLSAILDPDPSISYSIGVIDFGTPSTFEFFFSTPIVPTGPCTEVAASIEGGLTDFTGNGVSVIPVGTRTTLQTSSASAPLTDLLVDVGDPVSHAATGVGGARTYGLYTDGPKPGPVGTFTTLSTSLKFTLSGGGDGASFTGFTSIFTADCPVPDAGAGLAGLLGLGALGLMKRRSRKS